MSSTPNWFDNHCHLHSTKVDAAAAHSAAVEAGVTKMITVGCTLEDSLRAIEVAERFDNVWATAGVHPHDAKDGVEGIAELLAHPRVVAVGECGFDLYYNHSDVAAQQEAFRHQIRLAHEHNKALVIHTRDAWDATFRVLDEETLPPRTVFHCFTGGPAEAEQCLERGAMLSFSGIVTFNNATEVRDAAAITPTDRMLVETDTPYLAPVPHRGKPNQPAFVVEVGKFLAEHLSRSESEIAALSWDNAHRLFGL